jgi:predicted transcriptional regulator
MKVLLSIKPEFAEKIFNGTKKYEFRKSIFKKNVDKVVVYASSPVQRVIGEFIIADIIYENKETLWQKTKDSSGITKEFYDEYFINKEKGYAIQICNAKLYSNPLLLADFGLKVAPQSYVYIEN